VIDNDDNFDIYTIQPTDAEKKLFLQSFNAEEEEEEEEEEGDEEEAEEEVENEEDNDVNDDRHEDVDADNNGFVEDPRLTKDERDEIRKHGGFVDGELENEDEEEALLNRRLKDHETEPIEKIDPRWEVPLEHPDLAIATKVVHQYGRKKHASVGTFTFFVYAHECINV
jgi:hypothetical protein